MREDRLSGRIRHFIFVDTDNMLADGFTKAGVFPALMRFNTTGHWQLHPHKTRSCKVKRIENIGEFTESDLLNLKE